MNDIIQLRQRVKELETLLIAQKQEWEKAYEIGVICKHELAKLRKAQGDGKIYARFVWLVGHLTQRLLPNDNTKFTSAPVEATLIEALDKRLKAPSEPVAVVTAEYEWEDYTSYKTNRLHIVPLKAIHESGLKEGDKLYTMPHTSITEGAT